MKATPSSAREALRCGLDRLRGYPPLPRRDYPKGKNGPAMTVLETSRVGTDAHTSALGRLDAAGAEQRNRIEARDPARGTPREHATADDLAGANEQVAAREAWVRWVERGY
jgi:hypothetical protein